MEHSWNENQSKYMSSKCDAFQLSHHPLMHNSVSVCVGLCVCVWLRLVNIFPQTDLQLHGSQWMRIKQPPSICHLLTLFSLEHCATILSTRRNLFQRAIQLQRSLGTPRGIFFNFLLKLPILISFAAWSHHLQHVCMFLLLLISQLLSIIEESRLIPHVMLFQRGK